MPHLHDARLDDGGLLAVLDGAVGRRAGSLEGLDDVDRFRADGLAEDDVAVVEPRGDDGGDEELGAVAVKGGRERYALEGEGEGCQHTATAQVWDLRVRAGVGHGQQEGAVVLELEVLVGELLAVNGAATGAVATGEVTTLEHELGDDAVEGRGDVALALLALGELTEVLGGLGDDVVEELELNAAGLVCLGVFVSIAGIAGSCQGSRDRGGSTASPSCTRTLDVARGPIVVVEDRALPLDLEETGD